MRGKRTDLSQADCAIARALQVIGDWWSLLIIRESFLGAERFGEFQTRLGMAKNILSSRLKKLVEDGILQVESDGTASTRHRYVLSPRGESLYTVLIALWQWGEDACFAPGEMKLAIVDSELKAPLARLEPRSRAGKPVGPRDFRMVNNRSRPPCSNTKGS